MFRTLLAFITAVVFAVPALAQTYPSKPIRLIVPFPPGGGTDFVARTVATELSKSTGWTIVVENKAGAAGTIGLLEASRAPNEGYDLVIGQADNMIIAPATLKNPGLDPAKDLTAVIQVAISPNLIMAQADSKFRTLGDAIAAAKSNPGSVNYGTAGHGTFANLAIELLMQTGGFKWVEVPYKGAAPAITDLLGGHVQLAALSVASGMPQIKAGKLRGLVVTATKRSPALPDVPTIAESGFPGFEAVGWLGILVPNGTPPAVIARLNLEFGKVMQSADVQKALIAQGVEPTTSTPEAFGAMIRSETAKWQKVVRDAGIKPE
ncbi:MAG: tripartite tricarboxylate transporter substrate binding protein [Betaproteobacteria bacterium]|nr:tripartite tricarboxylate transporter substrate binding protein [Betaproteobacteria bacterium]MCC7218858.1 tripartite tricarboxylate transporter substrate binding protein [Burkholderiales bacterium]